MRNRYSVGIIQLSSFVFALLFSSCNNSTIYDETVKIPQSGWMATSPAYFDVEIDDTEIPMEMYLTIKNNTVYPYSNIYFFITVMFPDGRMARDTVNYVLADKYGKWLGKGMGSEKTVQVPYRTQMYFPEKGTYRFYIEQGMRTDTLKGIMAVGIKLEKEY